MTDIVVLDGATMNPGDLNWARLEELGACTFYDRTPNDKVIERCDEAEIVITNKVVFSKSIIARLARLKYIGVSATGYNIVDINAAKKAGVVVTNVPAYSTMSVAQMVLAHILNLTQHVAQHSDSACSGAWAACPDFSYWDFPLIELDGLTLGIVGLGRIGSAVAKIALAFGMKVIYSDHSQLAFVENLIHVDQETLFSQSDIVTLHCPLTPETEHLVNAEMLAHMKSSAFLINTSRGLLVDELALAEALNSGRIAGAGLDVLTSEPPAADNPLLSAANCFITPHIAWATKSARQRLLHVVIENIKAFLTGEPQNVVN